MKHFLTLLLLLGCLPLLATRLAADDEEAVREAIAHYFRGHATGDGAHFERVFHPDSKLFWVRDGVLRQRTAADYIASASGQPPADEAERHRRITHIDITGDAAVARVELDYPRVLITDYMSLLKVDGRWQIVNKIYHVEPKK